MLSCILFIYSYTYSISFSSLILQNYEFLAFLKRLIKKIFLFNSFLDGFFSISNGISNYVFNT
jgi:hypothetical protein